MPATMQSGYRKVVVRSVDYVVIPTVATAPTRNGIFRTDPGQVFFFLMMMRWFAFFLS